MEVEDALVGNRRGDGVSGAVLIVFGPVCFCAELYKDVNVNEGEAKSVRDGGDRAKNAALVLGDCSKCFEDNPVVSTARPVGDDVDEY
jgi:hypothetical protein